MSSEETAPTPAPVSDNVQPSNQPLAPFAAVANISAIVVTAVLIAGAVKLTTFLSDSYYFSLHSFIGGDNASPFIISTPPSLTREEICERAAAKRIRLNTLCWSVNDAVPSPDSTKQLTTPGADASPQPLKELEAQNVEAHQKLSREQQEEDRQIREIVAREPQAKSIFALIIRWLIPLAAGALVFCIYGAAAFPAAGLGGILAVFILFWPIVYLWGDLKISDDWSHKKNLFLVMYGAYAVLFFYLTRLGALLASNYLTTYFIRPTKINWRRVLESLIAGVIAGSTVKLLEHFVVS